MKAVRSQSIPELEASLNEFNSAMRQAALVELARRMQAGELPTSSEKPVVNLHCHTFYSFNAYGYSPSGLAWLAKRQGYQAIGMVDFDVLDGVEEFLQACELVGVRGSAGIETRVYVPEFASHEITSPGEPGITYHMGIGFTSSTAPQPVSPILERLRKTASERNRSMIARLNAHLAPVVVDYDRDVLPLTPGGNATERHILKVYLLAAENTAPDLAAFWADKLALPVEKVSALLREPGAFQNTVRSKLMKLGGIGYVKPNRQSFPTVEEYHELITACGALPCAAWLDGTSSGEQETEKLLHLFLQKGAAALNLIPDRNWNIPDAETRRKKVAYLYQVVEMAQKLDLPLNVGTEMNSYGQKLVDDFDAPELQPVRQAFLDGSFFIYGHTMLQRHLGLGYQSDWARQHLPSRRERNHFYTQAGRLLPPGAASKERLQGLPSSVSPASLLVAFDTSSKMS